MNNQIEQGKVLIDEIEKTEQTITDLLAILYELGYHKRALELVDDKEEYKSSELLKWKGYH